MYFDMQIICVLAVW